MHPKLHKEVILKPVTEMVLKLVQKWFKLVQKWFKPCLLPMNFKLAKILWHYHKSLTEI